MWKILSIIYGVILTIALIYIYYKKEVINSLINSLNEELKTEIKPSEKAELISAAAQLYQAHIPWFEKALSAIGIVAFISMTTVTSIQTIKTSIEEVKVERLKDEFNRILEKQKQAEMIIDKVAQSIIISPSFPEQINDNEKDIIEYQLDRLIQKGSLTREDIKEMYHLSLLLGKYSAAIKILEKNINLIDMSAYHDQLTMAEYYYLMGSHSAAKSILSKLFLHHEELPKPIIQRMIVLKAALNIGGTSPIEDLTKLFGLKKTEAEIILNKKIKTLKEAASALNTAKSNIE